MMGLRSRLRSGADPIALVSDTWVRSGAVDDAMNVSTSLAEDRERPICAADGCEKEPRFWKKTARPMLEGQWACSKRCAAELVRATMHRQHRHLESPANHRHRIPLGLMLLEQGTVTYFQLRQALDAQKSAGYGRIGDWLDQVCGVSDADVARALARQWNRPVLSAANFHAAQMALVLPTALREELRMVPVRIAAGKILYVAFEGPVDPAAESVIASMTGLTVESGLLADGEMEQAKRSLAHAAAPTVRTHSVADDASLVEAVVDTMFELQPFASRLVTLRGQWWLRMFLEPAAMSRCGMVPARSEDVMDVFFTMGR